jgi:MFS family permease
VSLPRVSIFLLVVIYLGFISLGLPDGTLGVAWPAIYPDLGVTIGLAGTITLVVTLLSGASGFASGQIVGRFGTGPVVLVSCVLTGAALVVISRAQGLLGLIAAAIPLGLGAGAVDAGLNGYVARHYSGRHMNWLHACWGVGATFGPLVMAHALGTGAGWRTGYLRLAGAQLALAAVFLFTLRLWNAVPTRMADDHRSVAARAPTLSASSFAGWLAPATFTLYAAVELTAGLWAGSILVRDRGLSGEVAASITAVYYATITLGRIAVGFIVERWGNRRIVAWGTGLALAGALMFAATTSPAAAVVSLGLLGLGLAPVYPCLMHEVPNRFAPTAAQIVIGRQSGAAYIGAALLPAAVGALAQHALGAVPWVIVGGLIALIAVVRRLDRLT